MISKRFTIKRLMLAIAGIAGFLALIQQATFATVTGLYVLALACLGWLPSRGRPRLAKWGFLGSATWLNLSMFVMYTYLPAFNNEMVWSAASLTFLPIAPGFGLSWVTSRPGLARRVRLVMLVLALTALPISMIMTFWPLRLGFYVSSPALNRLADRVDAGGKVDPGELAGIYLIQASIPVRYDGSTMLIINPDPRGIAGFARKKGAKLGVTDREWLQIDARIRDRWVYIAED